MRIGSPASARLTGRGLVAAAGIFLFGCTASEAPLAPAPSAGDAASPEWNSPRSRLRCSQTLRSRWEAESQRHRRDTAACNGAVDCLEAEAETNAAVQMEILEDYIRCRNQE